MGLVDDVLTFEAPIYSDPSLMPGVESVVITFYTGTTRTVYAQVFRGEPVPMGDGYRASILINFENHATRGLLPSEIDGGGGVTCTIGKNYGETAVALPMRRCTDLDKQADVGRVWVEVG